MKIFEITSDQRDFFDDMGFTIIEERDVGEYELVLLHHAIYGQLIGTPFQVGLQRRGRDFTNIEDQLVKKSIDSLNLHDLKVVLDIVIKWVSEYGSISIGSMSEAKHNFYAKVLARAGLTFKEKSVLGQRAIVVSDKNDNTVMEMPAMTRNPIGMGMTEYQNDRFVFSGGYRSGSSPSGQTRLHYEVYDLVIFTDTKDVNSALIGSVDLMVSDETGEIVGLVDITLKPKFRKGGRGSKIIQDIRDTAGKEITIHDIQAKAKGFWKKVGIKFTDRSETTGKL